MRLSRRQALYLGGSAVALLGAGLTGRKLLRKRFAPTPYDDLLALLKDRDAAAQIGETVLVQVPNLVPVELAHTLRQHIAQRPVADVCAADAAQGRILEAAGWVMPQTLGLVCALAAKAAG